MGERNEGWLPINLPLARKLRLEKGLNTKEIAKHCGVDPKTAYRWLNGTQNVSVPNLPLLAQILGCTVVELTNLNLEQQPIHEVEDRDQDLEFADTANKAVATLTTTALEGFRLNIPDNASEEEVSRIVIEVRRITGANEIVFISKPDHK